MSEKRFNIRVYGILINNKKEVLIADECRNGNFFTKFPGGGLQWGEGLKDCLKREFQEELSITINVSDLFYCTDFFIESAFKKSDQLISIYFIVNYPLVDNLTFPSYSIPFKEETERFRWVSLKEISKKHVTFPIDKIVADKLKTLI